VKEDHWRKSFMSNCDKVVNAGRAKGRERRAKSDGRRGKSKKKNLMSCAPSALRSMLSALCSILFLPSIFIASTALCEAAEESELQSIVIPAEATLTGGEQLQFRIEIKNDGNIDVSSVNVEWKVMGGIGDISSDGLFTASQKAGRGMVRASAKIDKKQLTAYALVKIAEGSSPPRDRRIVVIVRPESVTLAPGSLQEFTVEPAGNTQWRVIPPKAGSITLEGLFTAGQSTGKAIVVATVRTGDGEGTGRANIVVSSDGIPSPAKLKLNIKPSHARVDRGGSADFEVEVTGLSDQYPLEWEVSPSELGYIVGTGSRISFNATNESEGRALITVKLRTETEIGMDWATVDVGGPGNFPSTKLKIFVVPEEASIKVGESVPFTVNTTGDTVQGVKWSVAPKKIGTIDENGLFSAAAPGWGLVIAKFNMEKGIGVGQARIFVGAEASKPSKVSSGVVTSGPFRIAISPQKAETHANGDPVKFTVTDTQGNPLTGIPIRWKVVPSSLGSIDQTGTFVPGSQEGYALITAKVEGAKGSSIAQARVMITSQAGRGRFRVVVTGPESLRIGDSYDYSASVIDSEGATVEFAEAEFEWRVVPPKLGQMIGDAASVRFTPAVAGRGVIIVDVKTPQGTGTGRISITVASN
jgi:hypothetical protein